MKTPVIIGADHAGFKLKEKLKDFFDTKKIAYIDVGNSIFDKDDDYPDFGIGVAEQVIQKKTMGVLVCGSSYGVCIVANKKKGIRAVSVSTVKDAKLAREHNDANVLCLSGWNAQGADAKRIVTAFLNTHASKEKRHVRRVNKIKKYESKLFK
jgi:ribose 5-phosphate isomerase B